MSNSCEKQNKAKKPLYGNWYTNIYGKPTFKSSYGALRSYYHKNVFHILSRIFLALCIVEMLVGFPMLLCSPFLLGIDSCGLVLSITFSIVGFFILVSFIFNEYLVCNVFYMIESLMLSKWIKKYNIDCHETVRNGKTPRSDDTLIIASYALENRTGKILLIVQNIISVICSLVAFLGMFSWIFLINMLGPFLATTGFNMPIFVFEMLRILPICFILIPPLIPLFIIFGILKSKARNSFYSNPQL